MDDKRRRKWTDADIERLIYLWDAVKSVTLIAIMMDRPPSSIQTQASRKSLTRRTDTAPRNRRRWTDDEDARLDDAVTCHSYADGLDIQSVAESLGRSVDAVASRLVDRFGLSCAALKTIRVPKVTIARKPAPARSSKSVERNCISCGKLFVSQDRKTIWKCHACRERSKDDWLSEYF